MNCSILRNDCGILPKHHSLWPADYEKKGWFFFSGDKLTTKRPFRVLAARKIRLVLGGGSGWLDGC